MPDEVVLYNSCVVPLCRPVLILLKQNKIPHTCVEINILQNEHLTPSFLEKNPRHTLPLLEDGGMYISEGPAILSHLHDHHALARCNKELQAQVDQLISWSVEELHWNIGFSYVYPQIYEQFALEGKANDDLIESGIIKICQDLDKLEKSYLSSSDWLLGPQTSADLYVACIIVVLELVSFDFKMWPNVQQWLKCVKMLDYWDEVHKFHNDIVEKIREETGG